MFITQIVWRWWYANWSAPNMVMWPCRVRFMLRNKISLGVHLFPNGNVCCFTVELKEWTVSSYTAAGVLSVDLAEILPAAAVCFQGCVRIRPRNFTSVFEKKRFENFCVRWRNLKTSTHVPHEADGSLTCLLNLADHPVTFTRSFFIIINGSGILRDAWFGHRLPLHFLSSASLSNLIFAPSSILIHCSNCMVSTHLNRWLNVGIVRVTFDGKFVRCAEDKHYPEFEKGFLRRRQIPW